VTTIRSSGRPQLSNIVYTLSHDEVASISVTDSGPKANNLRRDAASLYVADGRLVVHLHFDHAYRMVPTELS
jgi:hypothetical protein